MVSRHLGQCLEVILDATSGLTPEAAARRAGDRWSVVEIVEHLQRAFSGTAKGFDPHQPLSSNRSRPSW
jgi:hypothetical protein